MVLFCNMFKLFCQLLCRDYDTSPISHQVHWIQHTVYSQFIKGWSWCLQLFGPIFTSLPPCDLFVPLPFYAAFILFPLTFSHLNFLSLDPLVHLCVLFFMRTCGVIQSGIANANADMTPPNSQTYFCVWAAFT